MYLDLAEAAGRQLIQYENLESLQQTRIVSTAHLARRELELKVPLGLDGLPQLGPCRQAPEVSRQRQQACGVIFFVWDFLCKNNPSSLSSKHTSTAILHCHSKYFPA